jgi:hypothetical protein
VEIFAINRPAAGAAAEPEHDVDHLAVPASGWSNGSSRAACGPRLSSGWPVFHGNPVAPHAHCAVGRHGLPVRTGRSDRAGSVTAGRSLSPLELQLEGMEVGVPYADARAAIETLRCHFRRREGDAPADSHPLLARCSSWRVGEWPRRLLAGILAVSASGASSAGMRCSTLRLSLSLGQANPRRPRLHPGQLSTGTRSVVFVTNGIEPILLNGYLESFFPADRPPAT